MDKEKALKLAEQLLVTFLPERAEGWRVEFISNELFLEKKVIDGKAYYSEALTDFRLNTLQLDRKRTEVSSEEHVKQNILHEIAHILDYYEREVAKFAAHDDRWKEIAEGIGYKTNLTLLEVWRKNDLRVFKLLERGRGHRTQKLLRRKGKKITLESITEEFYEDDTVGKRERR